MEKNIISVAFGIFNWLAVYFAILTPLWCFNLYVRGSSSCYVYPPNRRDPCEEKKCNFGARCVPSLDGSTARCQCPEQCNAYGDSVGSWPLCGSDGRDYSNECSMERESCITLRNIKKKYDGDCDPCSKHSCSRGQICLLDDVRRPTCQCNSTCPSQISQVCGTDGRTYPNLCWLTLEACRRVDVDLKFLSEGRCLRDAQLCLDTSCGWNERCRLNDDQTQASCFCPWSCHQKVMKPVCASTGKSFDNECLLKRKSCQEKELTLKHFGHCDPQSPCLTLVCNFGGICDSTNDSPTCLCYDNCSLEYNPVCGNNGVTYTNECHMKLESCRRKQLIDKINTGPCNGCETKRCDFYSICDNSIDSTHVRCICPTSCVQVEDKVCGSNHVTYLNECELKVASCRYRRILTILHRGTCRDCDQDGCGKGVDQCSPCPNFRDPVCSSEDVTYTNECHLRRKACASGRNIQLVHAGRCLSPNSTSDEDCNHDNCKFGGICLRNNLGHVECSCQVPCRNRSLNPVCGSDGRTYMSECHMNEESCVRQEHIWLLLVGPCKGDQLKLCGDESPAINPLSGTFVTCQSHLNNCPPGGYCFNSIGGPVCCAKFNESCKNRKFGCCVDGSTPALGDEFAGCPEVCRCKLIGSYGRSCDRMTRQCTCKPGVGGLRCDRCEANFWGLNRIAEGNTGCLPCACNMFGSVREDCEQSTGKCVCKPHVVGVKCDSCSNGVQLTIHGCAEIILSNISNSKDVCESVRCDFNGVCQNMGGGKVECVCQVGCGNIIDPSSKVCGTDGITYSSACYLKISSCRLQRHVLVKHYGPCLDIINSLNPLSSSSHQNRISKEALKTLPKRRLNEYCNSDDECTTKDSSCRVEKCRCNVGFKETHNFTCQIIRSLPMWIGQSYLKYNFIDTSGTDLNITIVFRPKDLNGILIYMGQSSVEKGDFAVVYIKHGRCHYKYDLGSGSTTLHSNERLKLNKRYKVVVIRIKRHAWLNVEQIEFNQDITINQHFDQTNLQEPLNKVYGISPGDLFALNSNPVFFLGHVPNASEFLIKNLGISSGFHGCMEKVVMNCSDGNMELDFDKPQQAFILEEHQISECHDFPCDDNPCHNNSTCIHLSSVNFHCLCSLGFAGSKCELKISQEKCQTNICLNSIHCFNDTNSNEYFCSCIPGYHGELCSLESSNMRGIIDLPEFNGRSYVALKLSKSISQTFSFEIWFLSRKPDGCLLFGMQDDGGDFVILQIINRFVQLQFHLGTILANITSIVPITLRTWNRVSIFRMNQFGSLTLNDMEQVKGYSNGPLKELNLPQFVYIGGYKWNMSRHFGIHMKHVTQVGLDGVIQKFYENGDHIRDVMSRSVDHNEVTNYNGPPCPTGRNPCLQGAECQPRLNVFSCGCPPNYTGEICNQVIGLHDDKRPMLFNGRTHHLYKNRIYRKERSQSINKYEMRFRATSPDGLILLQKSRSSIEGDFLVLALNEGHLEVTLNLGKEKADHPFVLRYQTNVVDFQWHFLSFYRDRRLVMLNVDNSETPILALTSSGAAHLDTDGFLHIGSGDVPRGLPATYSHGFNGCLLDVSINDEALNLLLHRHVHSDIKFCS